MVLFGVDESEWGHFWGLLAIVAACFFRQYRVVSCCSKFCGAFIYFSSGRQRLLLVVLKSLAKTRDQHLSSLLIKIVLLSKQLYHFGIKIGHVLLFDKSYLGGESLCHELIYMFLIRCWELLITIQKATLILNVVLLAVLQKLVFNVAH